MAAFSEAVRIPNEGLFTPTAQPVTVSRASMSTQEYSPLADRTAQTFNASNIIAQTQGKVTQQPACTKPMTPTRGRCVSRLAAQRSVLNVRVNDPYAVCVLPQPHNSSLDSGISSLDVSRDSTSSNAVSPVTVTIRRVYRNGRPVPVITPAEGTYFTNES